MEQKCVFCAIVSKQVPAKVVYEDDNSTAVLDIAPRSTGMTLVVPKQHLRDFDENFELSTKVFSSALIVAEMVKQALQPKAVSISIMPSEMQHFHIRIYPMYENEIPLIENQPKKVSEEELNAVAEKIKSIKINLKKEVKEEKVEEKPKEKERSKEDIYWIKRAMQLT